MGSPPLHGMLGAFWKRQAEGNTDRKRIGIYEGKHTFREEAGRGAGGGGGVWRSGDPQGPRTSQTNGQGAGAARPPPPCPFRARSAQPPPPRRPLGNRLRQKGGRFAGLGDGSRLPGGLLAIVRSGGGGIRRRGRGGGGLGSGPPEGEYAPLIA